MSIGPQLPPHLQKSTSDSEDDDGQSYGPKLPSEPCRGPRPLAPPAALSSIGPQLPPGLFGKPPDLDSDSSDDEIIGPMPPKPGQEITPAEAIAKSFEARAEKMRDKLEGI
jgi:hypothetical protein